MYYQANSILERLIHPFKYSHQADIFRIFVPYMAAALSLLSFDPRESYLVPIPLHKTRENERGYNQAALLAKWVAKMTGAQVFYGLCRVRQTEVQALRSSKVERMANMQNAFQVLKPPSKDSHIVLVDDIVTTGSTLLACRKVLLEAGIQNVSALTLADRERKPQNPWD